MRMEPRGKQGSNPVESPFGGDILLPAREPLRCLPRTISAALPSGWKQLSRCRRFNRSQAITRAVITPTTPPSRRMSSPPPITPLVSPTGIHRRKTLGRFKGYFTRRRQTTCFPRARHFPRLTTRITLHGRGRRCCCQLTRLPASAEARSVQPWNLGNNGAALTDPFGTRGLPPGPRRLT